MWLTYAFCQRHVMPAHPQPAWLRVLLRKRSGGQRSCEPNLLTNIRFQSQSLPDQPIQKPMAHKMHAQNAVSFGICQHFHQTVGLIHRFGATIGGKREAACVIRNTSGFQFGFGLTDPRDFRVSINNPRNRVIIDVRLLTGNLLSNQHTLFRGFVCQHGPTMQSPIA